MRRFHADPDCWEAGRIRLSIPASHHLLNVLRIGPGETVEAFDGRGRVAKARPAGRPRAEHGPVRLVLEIEEERRDPAPPSALALFQALPKGNRMDLVVEKATEIGASHVFPVITERVVGKETPDGRRDKTSRWKRIAVAAATQCGGSRLPEIGPPLTFESALEEAAERDLALIAALDERATPLHRALERTGKSVPRTVALLVGPEGDFTANEVSAAIAAGMVPVSFGKRVLRTETAALYGLSVLAYELFEQR